MLSFTSSSPHPHPLCQKLGVRKAVNRVGVGCGGRLEAKHITQSLSPDLNSLSPERLDEPEWSFASRIWLTFLSTSFNFLCNFSLVLCPFPFGLVYPPFSGLPLSSSFFHRFVGCRSLGPWVALGACSNAICFADNSILLFP